MQPYRFNCLDDVGQVILSHIVHVFSDEDASEIAKGLLHDTPCNAIEAWHESRLVHRIHRGYLGGPTPA